MAEVQFRFRCDTVPGDRVLVVGGDASIGDWDPSKSKVELKTDAGSYPVWSGSGSFKGEFEYKFVVLNGGNAKWEVAIPNRKLSVSCGIKVEADWDKGPAKETALNGAASAPSPTPAPAPGGAPASAPAPAAPPAPKPAGPPAAVLPAARVGPGSAITLRIAEEDGKRKSWRNKLDLSRTLLEGGEVNSLNELACLQAYLTWVASGQIKCEEDGGHHRPCAHADASRKISALLWQFAARGDAERFIARRIFPSLPSFADQFTCAVPMTRIRDIAHRNDIPQDLKNDIKHNLQNKLHRCADPGDMVTCHNLIEKCRKANCYPESFMREFEIFYKELKEFFNAGGLDEQAQQLAASDSSIRGAVDTFVHLKQSGGNPSGQLHALSDLRALVAPRAEGEQTYLLMDLELEKYSFVLLSQLANELENGQGSGDWWQRLLSILAVALRQSELAGIAPEECAAVAREAAAAAKDTGDASKAPFVFLRLAAAADRALRICFALTQQLEGAYTNVPALGAALNIDGHAVSVFVEAEMRTSILFQVSKFVQLVTQQAKRAANLPLWTAISAGATCGRVMRLSALSEAWTKTLPAEGAIVLCDEAGGDEELPALVRGVVVGRDLPVLSHLALRARQLGAVFGCTSERRLFEGLASGAKDGAAVRLTVDASGDVRMEGVADSELTALSGSDAAAKAKSSGKTKAQVGELSLKETKVMPVIDLADSPQTAGSKAASSGKLESIAKAAGFMAPQGFAVPFGVMTKAVSGKDVDDAVAALQKALDDKSDKLESLALAARAAVEKCKVPKEVVDDLIKGLPAGTDRVAVRSSANSEDLEGVSGAGLHDSVLGVDCKDPAALEKAVLQVWSSMFTLRAVQSRHAAGMPLFKGIAMGVLVQPMVSLEGNVFAFIGFSKHVVDNDAGSVYLEVCIGLGETLASANEPGTPYRLIVQKAAPHAVKIVSLASFSYGLQDAAGGPAMKRVDYSQERLSTDQAFLEKFAREVADVAVKVEQQYGAPMDMEGVVLERGGSREIHLVQARPIVEG
eukprot:CAMPEP_0203859482 /NCGR_PEP_ID=MMETSP0359-20131031/11872_1 /ASSEMBLY_ACC=CAM_ASM_000338 /TAXON_ID=268821 /ORGANISM="Scrippsiella Hangoei, Strain SHTV-5" /LENGTH=1030 /DNA_ID=CAMNT_0050776405 /DNA_START=114 /DNA_END=3206 /DNA_ORIENTATION=-